LNVPGVISPPLLPLPPFSAPDVEFETIARKAAVLGVLGGYDELPPVGVRPVEGVRPVRRWKVGSKARLWLSRGFWEREELAFEVLDEMDMPSTPEEERGPASMAGESGPARREAMLGVSMFQLKGSDSLTGVVI
jgi:hypothetical protein